MSARPPLPTPRLVYPFGPIHGISEVTDHAIARFKERAGVIGTFGEVLRKLELWLQQSRRCELKDKQRRLVKLLNNGCKPAEYRYFGALDKSGWILVLDGNRLVTVHRNESNEWRGLE